MSRKCLLIDSNMLWGKAQGLKEDFNMGSPETSDTKPRRDDYTDLEIGLD